MEMSKPLPNSWLKKKSPFKEQSRRFSINMASLLALSSTLIRHLFHTYPLESTHSTLRVLKNIPIKGVDDKSQITATFAISATGVFLPVQLIYPGKTKTCLPNFQFPRTFQITYTKTTGPIKRNL